MKASNYQAKSPSVNDLIFGTQNSTGDTVNFRIQDVVNLTQSPSVVSTNTLTTYTILSINTYFTGTAGASFAITLPTASESIDGVKYVIMSTTNRPTTTWVIPGANAIVGSPSSLVANTPICFQYNNSNTTWYISM
jgi:ribosomal protein S8E